MHIQLIPEEFKEKLYKKGPEAVQAYARAKFAAARENFWEFRRMMRPGMYQGWWQEHAANELQQFWEELKRGQRPKLMLFAPPQHGKSETVRDFIAWVTGHGPDMKTIFSSYSDELGTHCNLNLQRMFLSPMYQACMPRVKVRQYGDRNVEGARRNTNVIEYIGRRGSFRNTTVDGQITGFGLHLGVIDDPIKGRAEAQSLVIREKAWNWFTNDFFSRFDKDAGFIMIMTRWHVDDPAGRWLEHFPDTKVLTYRAYAENKNDWTVKSGYRKVGEELFPEHKPKEFLEERRKVYTSAAWESLYQQHPIIVGGGIFPVDRIKFVQSINRSLIKRSVRYFDKAATEDGGAYTAGVLMHETQAGEIIVEDVVRGQWSSLERETRIKQCAIMDKTVCPRGYQIWVEQEPGSGGKESAENSIRNLKGFAAFADKVSGQGNKEARAEPYAAQVQGGNVFICQGAWNRQYFQELEEFPQGKYRDQVDASSGAFNKIALGSTWDPSMKWTGPR
jgi:predicted phage terminase large subunit-like protein